MERRRRLVHGILHAFPKRRVHPAVDERLRGHHDLPLLFLDLEVVSRLEAETVVQFLGITTWRLTPNLTVVGAS